MKIAIDIQTVIGRPTGVGLYAANLVRELAALTGDERFLLFYFDFRRRFRGLGIENPRFKLKPVHSFPGRIYNSLSENFGWPDITRFGGRCDLYHFPNFIIHPLKKGKAVVTVHDLSFRRFPQYTEPTNMRRLRKRFTYTLERADTIIAVSEFTKSELVELYDVASPRIAVIYNGARPAPVKPLPGVLPGNYFLFVGTIEPRKNFATLLAAWRIVRSRLREKWNYKLLVAGGRGWRCPPAREQAKGKGLEDEVVVLDYVRGEHLPAIYSGAKALVYPSLYEGFGIPPIEAMAYGTPVIASTAPALPEVVGDAALLVDPHRPEAIADAIMRIHEDSGLREDLIVRGRKRAALFTWQRTAEETLSLYRKLSY